MDLPLASAVWKMVVGEQLTELDLASFDVGAYNLVNTLSSVYKRSSQCVTSCQATGKACECSTMGPGWSGVCARLEAASLLEDLNWTATLSDGSVVELVNGGSQKPVLLEDLGTFLRLYCEARLGECGASVAAFREGLLSIIPESAICLLTGDEFSQIVCGAKSIDIARLKEWTEYDDDVSPDDLHIIAFWQCLSEFTEEEKSAFLRFVWARPTLPPKGMDFPQKFKVQSAVGDDASSNPDMYLPKAHTCFFSINLPRYSCKEVVATKLRYAISHCTEMDADFRITDTDVAGWNVATGFGEVS